MKGFKCKAELVGVREVRGSLGLDTISECVRVVFVSALQKGSTTRTCKLPVEILLMNEDGLHVSGRLKSLIDDLIFCHIDAKNRRVVVLVVRRKSESAVSSSLDALVWRLESTQDADTLYKTFHEIRQNHKLNRMARKTRDKIDGVVDCASVSSDSAIESGSCDESGSGSGSSDECSYESESSNVSKEPGVEHTPKFRSLPAARILKELVDKDDVEHKEVVENRSSRPRRREPDIEDIISKLIPKDVRHRTRRDSSLPSRPDRSSAGIVSFSTGSGSSVITSSTMPATRCVFDPRGLRGHPASHMPVMYHPVGTLDYKRWQRHVNGLNNGSSNHKSTLARVMNALRRPLTLTRSQSVSRSRLNSGAQSDGQLRSVMKKSSDDSSSALVSSNMQFGSIEGSGASGQDKKNVTFNALTRVQVVDCR